MKIGRYGTVSIIAINYLHTLENMTPKEAWERAIIEIFGEGTSAQYKACPKNAFLGLCEEGLIKGVASGNYCKSIKNKSYALQAIKLVLNNPELRSDKNRLWSLCTDNSGISHNHQLDVVLACLKNNSIHLEVFDGYYIEN